MYPLLVLMLALLSSRAYPQSNIVVHDDSNYYFGRLAQESRNAPIVFFAERDSAVFSIEGSPVRIWGLDDPIVELPESIMDMKWRCKVFSGLARPEELVRVVRCDWLGDDAASRLLRMGSAQENCAETHNLYGTCNAEEE
jgi:hypothetical protein